jgi:hypothetical protein
MKICQAPWMDPVEEGAVIGHVLRPVVVSGSPRAPRLTGFRDEGRSVSGERYSYELPRPLRSDVGKAVRAEGSRIQLEIDVPELAGDPTPGIELVSRAAGVAAWLTDPKAAGIQTCSELREKLIKELTLADAPESLVVEIARRHRFHIETVCQNPRVQLRRRRELQLVDRVRQLDAAGLRWLARQPGLTIAERAGPRERILAIRRFQSPDTLENQVLLDVIRRSKSMGIRYLKQYQHYRESDRVRQVRDLNRAMESLLQSDWVQGVRVLAGVPTPNYALLSDRRYAPIWSLWKRILRHEQLFQSLEAWMPRLVAELAWIGCLAHLESQSDCRPALGKFPPLRYRPEFEGGSFLIGAQALPPVRSTCVVPSQRVDLVRLEQLIAVQPRDQSQGPWSALGELRPDFAFVVRRRGDCDAVAAVWAIATWTQEDLRALDVALGSLGQQIQRRLGRLGTRCRPCVVVYDAGGVRDAPPVHSGIDVIWLRDATHILVDGPAAIGQVLQELSRHG